MDTPNAVSSLIDSAQAMVMGVTFGGVNALTLVQRILQNAEAVEDITGMDDVFDYDNSGIHRAGDVRVILGIISVRLDDSKSDVRTYQIEGGGEYLPIALAASGGIEMDKAEDAIHEAIDENKDAFGIVEVYRVEFPCPREAISLLSLVGGTEAGDIQRLIRATIDVAHFG